MPFCAFSKLVIARSGPARHFDLGTATCALVTLAGQCLQLHCTWKILVRISHTKRLVTVGFNAILVSASLLQDIIRHFPSFLPHAANIA